MKLPRDETAIVLIESQNDFLSLGGSMYPSMSEQLKKRNVIANLQKLLNGARGKAKIFYVPFQAFKPGFPELKQGGPGTEGLRGIEMKLEADWASAHGWKARRVPRSPTPSSPRMATSSCAAR